MVERVRLFLEKTLENHNVDLTDELKFVFAGFFYDMGSVIKKFPLIDNIKLYETIIDFYVYNMKTFGNYTFKEFMSEFEARLAATDDIYCMLSDEEIHYFSSIAYYVIFVRRVTLYDASYITKVLFNQERIAGLYKHLCKHEPFKQEKMYNLDTEQENAEQNNDDDNEQKSRNKKAVFRKKKNIDITTQIEEAQSILNKIVGLDNIKEQIMDIVKFELIQQKRESIGLKRAEKTKHMVFYGSPGTGKTLVARTVAEVFSKCGIIPEDKFVEVSRKDLVGAYIGKTEEKVNKVIENALGGILFIDEAYSLYMQANDEMDYGLIAIDCLVKAMEDNRDDLIVIMAGYTDYMEDLINSNPGLKSRIANHLYFDGYNSSELIKLFESFCTKNMYHLEAEARQYLSKKLNLKSIATRFKQGNAREVRNMFEKVMIIQSQRLLYINHPTKEDYSTITIDDLRAYFKEPIVKEIARVEINKIIDFSAYKKQIEQGVSESL